MTNSFIKNSSNYTFETLKIHDYLNSDESEVLKVFLDKLFRIARTTKKQEDQTIIKKLEQLEDQLQFCMSYISQDETKTKTKLLDFSFGFIFQYIF